MLGSGAAGVVADVTFVGRVATSTGVVVEPVYVLVPPGRYWPAGASIRTVEETTALVPLGGVLDCVAIGEAAGAV